MPAPFFFARRGPPSPHTRGATWQESLEADKASLHAQLKSAEDVRLELVETVAQCGADRDFCFEVIRELKAAAAAPDHHLE